jgi:hypothetical protein
MPKRYALGGRAFSASPGDVPPSAEQRTFRERLGALSNLPPFLKLVCGDRSEAGPRLPAQGLQGWSRRRRGEAFDPSPKNIESRTARAPVGGLKVSLLTKQTRGDTVVANLVLRFGDEKSLMNRSIAGQFAGAMLMRGSMTHTRQQIQDEIDRLKARLNVFGNATNAGAQIETTRENLPAVLSVLRRDPAAAGLPRR